MSESGRQQELIEIKAAIKKLNRLYERMSKLASRKLKSYGPTLFLDKDYDEEEIEGRVKQFGEALVNFLKLRKRTSTALRTVEQGLKSLEDAIDIGEISTLIGFTVLGNRREYNQSAAKLMKYYEEQLRPIMPDIIRVVNYAGEASDFSKWLDRLLNRDPTKAEDDFTSMVIAIRDRDMTRFNEIYKQLERRIETEE